MPLRCEATDALQADGGSDEDGLAKLHPEGARLFRAFDKGGDKKLSREEFLNAVQCLRTT